MLLRWILLLILAYFAIKFLRALLRELLGTPNTGKWQFHPHHHSTKKNSTNLDEIEDAHFEEIKDDGSKKKT